jgi:Acyl-CoA thioesterase C-terminal domain/Acyl-CoA thioesterase N-terminal domain
MDFIYRIDGNQVFTSPHAAGPWDPTMQHGSAPSALVTWLAEQMPTASPMQISRVTIDLLRPVPVAALTFETEVLREGRKIQLCGIRLLANGVVVVRATVLKIRIAALALPPDVVDAPIDVPLPDQDGLVEQRNSSSPFVACMTVRAARGGFLTLGPGAVWYRLNRPVVEGADISQVMRAVAASDFSNGTSAVLRFAEWTFLNADLSVSLSRLPVGDWILLDSESWIGPDGAGIAASRLGDIKGYFGRAVQSLVIEKR